MPRPQGRSGQGGTLRSHTSIGSGVGDLGLPIPDRLKTVLSQLHNKESEDDQSDDHQEE